MDNCPSDLRDRLIQNQGSCYYRGLPTDPTFLARAPNPPWNPKILDDMGYFGEPVKKTLRPVGRHPIVEKWNKTDESGSLRFEILRSLEAVDWNSVDILRCGYEDEVDLPVVLMVSVQPGSISPAQASDVAARCEHILGLHELVDVSCELRASQVFLLQNLSTHQQALSSWWLARDYRHQLTDLLGTTIAGSKNSKGVCTKGPYLRVKTTNGGTPKTSICSLTCQHPLFGVQASKRSRLVVQPGDYNRRLAHIKRDKRSFEQSIAVYENSFSSKDCVRTKREESSLRRLRDTLAEINPIWKSYTAHDHIEDRIFGEVSHVGDGRNFKSDWALIRLDEDKHEQPLTDLRNQVLVADKSHSCGQGKLQSLFLDVTKPDETEMVTLEGTVPLAAFQEPDVGYAGGLDVVSGLDIPQCQSTLVLWKYGHATHLTCGLANQAFSVIRRRHPGAGESLSIAIGVTGYEHSSFPDGPRPRATSFCRAGDSGACVWDSERRVAGIVTAGSGSDPERGVTDVTYITPMEWILEDMKACGLEATLCE